MSTLIPATLATGLCCTVAAVVVAAVGGHQAVFHVRAAAAPLETLLEPGHEAWGSAEAAVWGDAPYTTEFRALHAAAGLAVRFVAVDDSPWHTLTERDDPLWNEEVVEIFIDPDGDGRNYAEIEINPANVVCDLQIFAASPEFSSDIGWDFDGLESRVEALPGADGETVGWIATVILPWNGFAQLAATAITLPPADGDRWKFNVFRIKRPGGPGAPQAGAIFAPWSPTTALSFHEPEAFRHLHFHFD